MLISVTGHRFLELFDSISSFVLHTRGVPDRWSSLDCRRCINTLYEATNAQKFGMAVTVGEEVERSLGCGKGSLFSRSTLLRRRISSSHILRRTSRFTQPSQAISLLL
ncbi:uncharacterized protein LOC143025646 [Oratosquilla oratoria]|uniref:uncharacterized protein LOC143025646 n=1 Tax=Oratosquilla oratoria TaxID=337810 RepID=UPI003F76E2E2